MESEDPSFLISFDARRRVITVVRVGFPDLAAARRYGREMREALVAITTDGEPFDILIDASQGPIVAQDVAEALREVAEMLGAAGARRMAAVDPSTISTMQMKRVIGPVLEFRAFSERADAEAWLAEAA